jgi:hypothetical protein
MLAILSRPSCSDASEYARATHVGVFLPASETVSEGNENSQIV